MNKETKKQDVVLHASEFRGTHRCHVYRNFDDVHMSSSLDNNGVKATVTAEEILRGYFANEYSVADFYDLCDEGLETDAYAVKQQGVEAAKRLANTLTRYTTSEKRVPSFENGKEVESPNGKYRAWAKPTMIFENQDGSIEVVKLRTGKPDTTQLGKKQDASVNHSIELYFLLQYARTLIPIGETREVKASYYFLRKSTDTANGMRDGDFFSGKGGNVVTLKNTYVGGKKNDTPVDVNFYEQIEEFYKGVTTCSEEDCAKCKYQVACKYQKSPETHEAKKLSGKKGKVVLTKEQQKIANFSEGVARVIATAGSGKTETMTERIATLIENGCEPEKILAITFTDAAALELKERISKKCIARNLAVKQEDIQAMTFHAFDYLIVRACWEELGFTNIPQIADQNKTKARRLIRKLLNETYVEELDYRNIMMNSYRCTGAIPAAEYFFTMMKENNLTSSSTNVMEKVKENLSHEGKLHHYPGTSISKLLTLFDQYTKILKEENLVTFADLEQLSLRALDKFPKFLEETFGFQHVVIDEFQDTSAIQMEMVKHLNQCSTVKSLMVVGDDDQAIYGFRRTSPDNIIHFFDKLKVKDGVDFFLTTNRRCTEEIVSVAENIVGRNKNKVPKKMNTIKNGPKPIAMGFDKKEEECNFIADHMSAQHKASVDWENMAFIGRNKSHLIQMASTLSQRGIPWILKNPMPLIENSRVQAAISLGNAFFEPDVDKFYFDYLVAKYDGEVLSAPADEIRAEIDKMKSSFKAIQTLSFEQQRSIYHSMLEDIKGTDEIYAYFLDLLYDNENIQEELMFLKDFQFLGVDTEKKMEQSYAGVVLTTAHSSKGLEWDQVYVSLNGFDTPKMSKKAIEETRRLIFVSLTRAKENLVITGQYYAYGNKKDGYEYNRFLMEAYSAVGNVFAPQEKVTTKTKSKSSGMSPEKIAEYEKKVAGATQTKLAI